MMIRFVIYGLLGWNIEILWTGLSSLLKGSANLMGHTSLWMFFIYALAGTLFEPVHNRIQNLKWYIRGLIWMGLIFAVELVTGLILHALGIYAWNYTGMFAVLGVIRLDYAPLWFATGLIFEWVHSTLLRVSMKKGISNTSTNKPS